MLFAVNQRSVGVLQQVIVLTMVLWTLSRPHASVANSATSHSIGHPDSHNEREPGVNLPKSECGRNDEEQRVECDGGRRTEQRPGMGTFLDLALARFAERAGRQATKGDGAWTFKHIQLVRVPKAASTAVSVVARDLAGCTPPGPCCSWPGDPAGSCPAKGLDCSRKVTGCTGHRMNLPRTAMILNPDVFSMSSLRDITARIVSAFLYAAPHSPPCARRPAGKVEYEKCFREMVATPHYQNVAARMFTGGSAYNGSVNVCLESGPGCATTLKMAIDTACDLNFIALSEAWKTSMLLLFEVVPWKAPSELYFPAPRNDQGNRKHKKGGKKHGGHPMETQGEAVVDRSSGRTLGDGSLVANVGRINTGKHHQEGIGRIKTPQLMDLARGFNTVDVELHQFVTAMFCDRLRKTGLLNHPLVMEELMAFPSTSQMCYNESATQATLSRFGEMATTKGGRCRLYQPLSGDGSFWSF